MPWFPHGIFYKKSSHRSGLWFDVGRERDTTAWPIVLNGGLLYMYLHFILVIGACLKENTYLCIRY